MNRTRKIYKTNNKLFYSHWYLGSNSSYFLFEIYSWFKFRFLTFSDIGETTIKGNIFDLYFDIFIPSWKEKL